MITMRLKGGLGNQLFQYSAAFALSRRLGQEYQFNPSFTDNMTPRGLRLPLLNVQCSNIVSDNELPSRISRLKSKYVNKAIRMMNFSKHRCGEYLYWIETRDEWQPEFFTIDAENIYVDGYFQSEEYFKGYRNDLLRQFHPNYVLGQEFCMAMESIRKCESVAVHVRRSDFKKDRNPFHYVLSAEYYINALNFMREKLNSPVFFWFSDDMEWVKENLGTQADYVFMDLKSQHGDVDDLMLIKECNHIITANSTFSWWGAWLNENKNPIRIVPRQPYGMNGMIPDGWIKL